MIDMTARRLEAAGFLDDGETLRSLGGFSGLHGVWVPPDVGLRSIRPKGIIRKSQAGHRYRRVQNQPFLCYPLPPKWPPLLLKLSILDEEALKSIGWHHVTHTAGLLNAFRLLAKVPLTVDVIQAVQIFAETWGPLWICRNAEHQNCYFSFHQRHPVLSSPCDWVPQEEPLEFVREAIRVNAVVEAIALLSHYNPPDETRLVPPAVWRDMDFPEPVVEKLAKAEGNLQKAQLASIIEEQLSLLRCVDFSIAWLQQGPASLYLSTGDGFIREVWVQVANLLCKARLYQCDGCKIYYARTGKTPKTGSLNYCPDCGENSNYKESKRLWAEKESSSNNEEVMSQATIELNLVAVIRACHR